MRNLGVRRAIQLLCGIAVLALAACASFRSAPNGPTPAWSIHLPGSWKVKLDGGADAREGVVTVHPDGSGGFLARAKGDKEKLAMRLRLVRVAGRDYLICASENPTADERGYSLFRVTWMPDTKSVSFEWVATEPLKAAVSAGAIQARISGFDEILVLEPAAGVERLLREGKIEFVPFGTATRTSP